MPTVRDRLPTPFNLSAAEWLDSAIAKVKELLVEESTPLLDIYDDLLNARLLLKGE